MLKTKRSDALVDAAKRRKELLGNIISAASSSTPALDGDIFDVESDPLPLPVPSAAPSSPEKNAVSSRSKTVSDKLKAILEDNDCGQPTHSKPSRSSKSVISNRVLLAQQKLSMLKALEEQSLQASILPCNPPASVDSDEEPCHALQTSSSAADSRPSECIRLKFMAKTKQHVIVAVAPNKPLVSYYPVIASKFGVTSIKVICEGRPINRCYDQTFAPIVRLVSGCWPLRISLLRVSSFSSLCLRSCDSAESLDLEEDFGLDVVLL